MYYGDRCKCSNAHHDPPKDDPKVKNLAYGDCVYSKKAPNPTLEELIRAEQINILGRTLRDLVLGLIL